MLTKIIIVAVIAVVVIGVGVLISKKKKQLRRKEHGKKNRHSYFDCGWNYWNWCLC